MQSSQNDQIAKCLTEETWKDCHPVREANPVGLITTSRYLKDSIQEELNPVQNTANAYFQIV